MAKLLKNTTLAVAVFGLGLFMSAPSEAATLPVGKTMMAVTISSADAPITVGGWDGGYGWNGGGCWRPACGWGYRRWGYRPWGYGYAGYGYRRPYYNYAYTYAPPVVAVPVVPVMPVVPYAPPPPVYGGYPYGGFGIGY
jgi:hypothetical protein